MMNATKGKWEKLDDGTFGANVRCGGRGAEMVGSRVVLVAKSGKSTSVKLVSLVRDYGAGDVAVFTVSEGL